MSTCPYVHASFSCPITHLHVFSLRPPCFLHVPWCHTFNLHYTCAYHVYTMRNPCPLTSSPNPNSISRLFPILLDSKSFQTALVSRSLTMDFILFFPFHFYFTLLFSFFYFSIFRTTQVRVSVTLSHQSQLDDVVTRLITGEVEGTRTKWCHTTWIPHVGLM